jgi:antitoxin (DNA-binding transcriptional repressor) of toxin-antitoxin stability system
MPIAATQAPAEPTPAQAVPPLQVSVRDLRANLAHYLQRAAAGESLVIVSRGQVVAHMGPPTQTPRRRDTFGSLRGRIKLHDGWDDPDEELYDLMENGDP